MSKKYRRKEFIKLAALGGLGLYVGACNTGTKQEKKIDKPVTPQNDISHTTTSPNVTFLTKTNPEFDTLRQGFNKRIDKHPAVIALCYNTAGVAEAIAHAKKNNLPVAIKSGGHCMEGFSCNNNGMVINLSELKKVEWESDEIVKVGPGVKVAEIYKELLPKKRILPAGSCGGVGIGGLTLGGGYGLFSRKYGLTCDHLTEVTMVDGNGNIHNSKDDKDLLWACRGGGSGGLGVITEMKFRTHPAPATLQSHRFKSRKLNTETTYYLLEQWFRITSLLSDTAFSAFVLNGNALTILVTDTGTANIKIINEFSVITSKAQTEKPKPLESAVQVFYGIQHPTYFKNSSAGFYKNFDDIKGFIKEAIEKIITTPGMIYQVNTLGGAIQNKEFEMASSYPHRAYNYISELQTYWEKEIQGARLEKAFDETLDIFQNNGITTEYCNYPSLRFKNWETAYYGDNYKRLQEFKRLYDPDNIIRHEQSIKA